MTRSILLSFIIYIGLLLNSAEMSSSLPMNDTQKITSPMNLINETEKVKSLFENKSLYNAFGDLIIQNKLSDTDKSNKNSSKNGTTPQSTTHRKSFCKIFYDFIIFVISQEASFCHWLFVLLWAPELLSSSSSTCTCLMVHVLARTLESIRWSRMKRRARKRSKAKRTVANHCPLFQVLFQRQTLQTSPKVVWQLVRTSPLTSLPEVAHCNLSNWLCMLLATLTFDT